MISDGELLRHYAESGAEDAFAELVRRHLNLVYSAALRQVNGDAHRAQDVAQTVFSDLARKAALLSRRAILTGWLYTSTHFAAAKAVRTECRRLAREQEAHVMNELLRDPAPNPDWEGLRPVLDKLMHRLNAPDREILLLRYFENHSLATIGETLNVSEDTARKRVDRALKKLRHFISKQGAGATAALAPLISIHAVQIAPAGMAAILTSTSLAGTAAGTCTTFALLKVMTMSKLQTAIIGAILVTGVLIPVFFQYRATIDMREENFSLRRRTSEMARLLPENRRLSNLLDEVRSAPALTAAQFSELLRLRGEVGVLKDELTKLRTELNAHRNSASSRALRASASTNYFPKESWAAAGYATPEAAVQSLSWINSQAMEHKDFKTLLSSLSPDLRVEAARHFAGKTDTEIAAEFANEAEHSRKKEGIRIVNKKTLSDDQVVLTFYEDGPDSFGSMRLKRVGNVWNSSDTTGTP